jgi:hypothetical protein
VTLWYDNSDYLVQVDIANQALTQAAEELQKEFESQCEQGSLYQLQLPELDLSTSQQACQYARQGLNETLTFFADKQGNLISFSYDVIDYQYLATKEKSAKKRRLMTTADFSTFKTRADVKTPQTGSRPVFHDQIKKYNSIGMEKKEVKNDGSPQQQQEQSFLSKYWMYILAAFLILPRLFGEEEPA